MGIIGKNLDTVIAREFTQEQIDRLRRDYFAMYMGPWAARYMGTPAQEAYAETRRPTPIRTDRGDGA